jgi:hypothetical protein
MAHFEVGKTVIAVVNQPQRKFKKGDIFPLEAIKKGCCNNVKLLLLINMTYPTDNMTRCSKCGCSNPLGEPWFDSSGFAPYDDSLSELTTDDILNEIHETVKIK